MKHTFPISQHPLQNDVLQDFGPCSPWQGLDHKKLPSIMLSQPTIRDSKTRKGNSKGLRRWSNFIQLDYLQTCARLCVLILHSCPDCTSLRHVQWPTSIPHSLCNWQPTLTTLSNFASHCSKWTSRGSGLCYIQPSERLPLKAEPQAWLSSAFMQGQEDLASATSLAYRFSKRAAPGHLNSNFKPLPHQYPQIWKRY